MMSELPKVGSDVTEKSSQETVNEMHKSLNLGIHFKDNSQYL